ncbi:MAG: MBL fold metallo-hydrolase [Treponema sp.]|nr:MBL fold metallo-hydrolase [Treponema sp.]
MLTVRFWGVRGSIPSPGPNTVVYGGNTSCLEIRAGERLLIIDLGSGAHPFGEWLIENEIKKYGRLKTDIFLTHTHWDHVMGFPMFTPVYKEGTELCITGSASIENCDLRSIIENQLASQYWPVQADHLAAVIKYNQIKETTLDMGGDLFVTSKYLNHPSLCLGYRIAFKGKSIVTVYDHEPFSSGEENEKIRQFIKGADIVIHDAQYTPEEYANHKGWGHCSYDHAIKAAEGIGIKRLVLFHHEPLRKDNELEQIEKSYANRIDPNIIMAREGLTLSA